jgi:sortase A
MGRCCDTARHRRRLLDALAAVLSIGGVLAIAQAAVLLSWQQPTRVLEARADTDPVPARSRPAAFDTGRRGPASDRLRRLAARERRAASPGSALGAVVIPAIGVRFVFVSGTGPESLKKGPGHYAGTSLPGEPGTVGLAGHRTTYLAPFRHIDALHPGDRIDLVMPYARFRYRVQGSRVVDPRDVWVLRHTRRDRLVLTACTPLFSDAQRLVVTARLSGVAPAGGRPLHRLVAQQSRQVPFHGYAAPVTGAARPLPPRGRP